MDPIEQAQPVEGQVEETVPTVPSSEPVPNGTTVAVEHSYSNNGEKEDNQVNGEHKETDVAQQSEEQIEQQWDEQL